MTTIAADLEGMAADSKCVFGESFFPCDKIYRLPDGSLLAAAGTDIYTRPFVEQMLLGELPALVSPPENENAPERDFEALHLTKDGLFVYDDSHSRTKVNSGIYAIGTGGKVALSWMLNKAHPKDAVLRAIEVDNDSGPPVHYETLKV